MENLPEIYEAVGRQIIERVYSKETQIRMIDFWNEFVRDSDRGDGQCIDTTNNINMVFADMQPSELLLIGKSSDFSISDSYFQKILNSSDEIVAIRSTNQPGLFMNFYDLAQYAVENILTAESYGLDMHFVRQVTNQVEIPKTIYEQLCDKGDNDEQVVALWNRCCETQNIDHAFVDMTLLNDFCFEYLDRNDLASYGLETDYLDNFITAQIHALSEDEYKTLVQQYEEAQSIKTKGDDYIAEWLRDVEKGQAVAENLGIEIDSSALTFKTPQFLQRFAGMPSLNDQNDRQSLKQSNTLAKSRRY